MSAVDGDASAILARRETLETEIVHLRDAIERARAAAGAATSDARLTLGRRLSDENEELRRDIADLGEQLRVARERARRRHSADAAFDAVNAFVKAMEWLGALFRR